LRRSGKVGRYWTIGQGSACPQLGKAQAKISKSQSQPWLIVFCTLVNVAGDRSVQPDFTESLKRLKEASRFRVKQRLATLTIRLSKGELVPTDANERKYLLLLAGQERDPACQGFSFLKFRTTGINAFGR
jgi:hypothetical protein